MYKRRPKSSSLGIVRTITQATQSNKTENISPNIQNGPKDSGMSNITQQNSFNQNVEECDEVLSDSEPTPKKKSRRFKSSINISSTPTVKEFSVKANQDINEVGSTSKSTKKRGDHFETSEKNKDVHATDKQFYNTISQIKKNQQSKTKIIPKSADEGRRKNIGKGTFLEDLLTEKGFILTDGSCPNVLKTDQAIFIQDISKELTQNNKELSRNVTQIIKDLEEYCENEAFFKYAVSFTETASDCDVSRGATQDSMMRLLLHVDCLQSQVSQLLLDKLTKFVMDANEKVGDLPIITWVRMILQCFRFTDRISSEISVNERFLDLVLGTSDITIQQEIVISLPDIITDDEHHHAALELSKMIRKSSPQLLASALEALTNLSLQPEVKAQIQPILMKALQKVQPEFLPNILKFLFTDCEPLVMDEIITLLRNELDLSEFEGDTANIQVLVISTLRDILLSSKNLSNVWQKNISAVKSQAEHKPIDMVMLFVILSTTNDPVRQRSIEAVFRNKIRNDMFTETLANETMESYIAVVKEYFNVVTKVASTLLKSTEPLVIEFASKIYIGMFVNMDGLWCKWVLNELQVCIGAGDPNIVRAALTILQHLTENFHYRVKPFGVILMLLLNKLSDLALSEVCQLMDILCHIAYSNDDSNSTLHDSSILQDEINILVQKQLASSQLNILRSGVVGCVMAIKHIATIPKNNTDSANSDNPEKGKKAIHLLEILLSSTRNYVEIQGLALDQLSHLLISSNTLNSLFIEKLSTLMRDNLQDSFLISPSDFNSNDDVVQCALQYYLDDESEEAIALNLCDLVVKECNSQSRPTMGLSCLHPLLRLLRGLEMSDLSEIDALLGCAINMPHLTSYTDFSQLTVFQQHVALHCLFHCINWFHEIINCFAFLVKKNEPEKVLIRLRTVVWMRELITRCLPLTMEYVPPTCYFQPLPKQKVSSTDKPAKKGNKKKLKKNKNKGQDNNESHLSGSANTSQAGDEDLEEINEGKTADLTKYKHYFRELDIDIWLILTQPLTLSPSPMKDGKFSPELGPSELLFLLDDYVLKLSHALTSSNKKLTYLKTNNIQSVGFENLNKFPAVHIAKNTIKLLPYLCSFLEKTVEYTQNLIKVNDGIMDSTGMFMEGSAEIKQCQGKLLKILAILFSWVGFQNHPNNSYLLVGLSNIACRVNGDQPKNKSKKLLVRECVQYLVQCKDHIVDLVSACTLVDTAIALVHHAPDDISLQTVISSMCFEMLGRQWYDLRGNHEKGVLLNGRVNELLSNYLSFSPDQLDAVISTLTWLSNENQQLKEKDSTLTTFPVISKLNLHLLIGGLLKGLEGAVKQKLEKQLNDNEQLELWSSFTQGLETLVTVIKAHDTKPNLKVFLRGCTNVLKLFLANGMSTCTFMFKHEPAVVSQILKKLQITTRYIQTICNFIKVSKDTGLTQFLPSIRAVMETILLRVKSIIVLNNCADAFFMGSMKNRDLKGQEIPSQETQLDDEEESFKNKSSSEPETDNENSTNETDNEENEETGESVSILF